MISLEGRLQLHASVYRAVPAPINLQASTLRAISAPASVRPPRIVPAVAVLAPIVLVAAFILAGLRGSVPPIMHPRPVLPAPTSTAPPTAEAYPSPLAASPQTGTSPAPSVAPGHAGGSPPAGGTAGSGGGGGAAPGSPSGKSEGCSVYQTGSGVDGPPAWVGTGYASHCTYTATVPGGYRASGTWQIQIQRNGQTTTYKTGDAGCGPLGTIQPGDVVSVVTEVNGSYSDGSYVDAGPNYHC